MRTTAPKLLAALIALAVLALVAPRALERLQAPAGWTRAARWWYFLRPEKAGSALESALDRTTDAP